MANQGGANGKEPAADARAPGDRTGEQVVATVCSKCHRNGDHGAPRLGDHAAWTKRVANRGLAAVQQSALKGHAGMPARGGMAELSDAEVKSAVAYMLNSGVQKAADATAAVAPAVAVAAAAPPAAAKADGKKVYDTVCTICHGAGVAGAPKFGDKAAWAPRLKVGMAVLYTDAIKGKNAMPAKGGNPALSDAEVKAAVDYMAAAAK